MQSGKAASAAKAVPRVYPMGLLNGALLLAAVSGILHLYIGVVVVGLLLGLPLVLIALVYFGGIGLIAANYRRELWLKVGLGWVVLVWILWALAAVVNGPGTRDPLAFVDKVVEVVLLGFLVRIWMLGRRASVPSKVVA